MSQTVSRADKITIRIGKSELQFLSSANRHQVMYAYVKINENISNGLIVTERTCTQNE